MKKARIFVPLKKVDEENRLVYGRITQEVVDKSGEMMDYASSKPYFEKWSNDIHAASGGLSKGNVRVMHGMAVAGKLTDLVFDDDDKAIDVCAKVVDDAEWEKVIEGCYTGFSVGGSYGKRWTEVAGDKTTKIKKFTAVPNEVSLVDNPCVPSATFTLTKADGDHQVEFKVENDDDEWPGFAKSADGMKQDNEEEAGVTNDDEEHTKKKKKKEGETYDKIAEPTNEEVVRKAEEMAKAADDGSTWMNHVEAARNELLKGGLTQAILENQTEEVAQEEVKEEKLEQEEVKVEKLTPPGIRQVWTTSDGKTFEKKADAALHENSLQSAELSEADKLRLRLAKALEAPREESIFSLSRIDDLHKAVVELGQARNEDFSPRLEKGMYTVSRFANLIGDVASLARTIKAEGALETDKSDDSVHKTLTGQLSSFGDSFMTYAKNQIAELVAGLDADFTPRAAYDYYYRAAGEGNDLAKQVVEVIEAVEEERPLAVEKMEKFAKALGYVDPGESDSGEGLSASLQKRLDDLEAEKQALKKVADEAVEKVEELAKRVQAIEDTPLPRAPRHGSVVEKTGDSTFLGKSVSSTEDKMAVLAELMKSHTPDEISTMLIKSSQSSGGQQMTLRSR